jgi:L-threonylcarbamoyladenylate synthase
MLKQAIKLLKKGGVGILPTDTIYGLLGSALNPKTVERIYKLRKRQKGKPMIVLISSLNNLGLFDIKLSLKQKNLLKKLWPNPVSVILACPNQRFYYLHRGTKTLAFRIPKSESLIKLLKKTGPLVAPSANPSGLKPAETIKQAKNYFKDQVEFYVDVGKVTSFPSTLISLKNDKIKILRKGAFKP